MEKNIKLIIAYDGTDFCGWQRQADLSHGKNSGSAVRTVQGEIENALEKIHGKHLNLTGAGRTDSGVHAAGQAANFYTDIESMPPERFTPALNSILSHEIRILESCEVNNDFHARFSAKKRLYRYYFLYRNVKPHEYRYNLQLRRFPRIDLLNAYSRLILGETDCSIFAGAGDSAVIKGKSKNRYIYRSCFFVEDNRLVFEICANAFLRNMVRSVAGTFLHYEESGTQPDDLKKIIASGKRSLAGPTLPAQGLFLWKVEY